MVENLLKSENIELLREYLTLSRQVSLIMIAARAEETDESDNRF